MEIIGRLRHLENLASELTRGLRELQDEVCAGKVQTVAEKSSRPRDLLEHVEALECLRKNWNATGAKPCSRITENSTLFWDGLNRLADPWWRDYHSLGLAKINQSDWLMGRGTDRGWRATLDWFVKDPDNLRKILDGNYDNNASKAPSIREGLGLEEG